MVETFNISDYSTTLITIEFHNINNVTNHMDQIQPHAWWSHPSMLLISSIHLLSFMCSYSLISNFFHVEFHPMCNYIHVLYIVHAVVNVIHVGWFSIMLISTTCVSFILVINFILGSFSSMSNFTHVTNLHLCDWIHPWSNFHSWSSLL